MRKSCNASDDLVWLSKLWVKLGSIQICYLICPYVVRWKSHTSYKCKPWKYLEFPAQHALCVQQICCVCFKLLLPGSSNQSLSVRIKFLCHVAYFLYAFVLESSPPTHRFKLCLWLSSPLHITSQHHAYVKKERGMSPHFHSVQRYISSPSGNRVHLGLMDGRANIKQWSSIVLCLKVHNSLSCYKKCRHVLEMIKYSVHSSCALTVQSCGSVWTENQAKRNHLKWSRDPVKSKTWLMLSAVRAREHRKVLGDGFMYKVKVLEMFPIKDEQDCLCLHSMSSFLEWIRSGNILCHRHPPFSCRPQTITRSEQENVVLFFLFLPFNSTLSTIAEWH